MKKFFVFFSFLLLAWCQSAPQEGTQKLSVVTTFSPLYSHTVNITKDAATVHNLVPAGTSVHDRQVTPSSAKIMEEADVIITNGLWLEEFLDGRLGDLQAKGVLIIDTSEGIALLEWDPHHHHGEEEGDHGHEEESHGHDEEEQHNEYNDDEEMTYKDPHIWLDVSNAIHQTNLIRNALAQADKDNAELYYDNANEYIKKLETLENDIIEKIALVENKQSFILFHDAFNYYLHAYGLEDQKAGVVQDIAGVNPSPQSLAALVETIREGDASIVFTEPQFSPQIVKTIQNETDVFIGQIDPIGANVSPNAYINNMEYITTELTNAMLLVGSAWLLGE